MQCDTLDLYKATVAIFVHEYRPPSIIPLKRSWRTFALRGRRARSDLVRDIRLNIEILVRRRAWNVPVPTGSETYYSEEQAAVALHPSHLHPNQSLSFALSLDFHPTPSEPTLQCAQRQIVFVTKFALPQSTGFEFRHQT